MRQEHQDQLQARSLDMGRTVESWVKPLPQQRDVNICLLYTLKLIYLRS